MALQITYWTQSQYNPNLPGAVVSDDSVAVGVSSAQSGVTPDNAVFVSVTAVENTRFLYNSANPTALSTSTYLGTGERLFLDAKPGFKFAAING